jgi:hypothetical protein
VAQTLRVKAADGPCPEGETEARKCPATCPRPHNQPEVALGRECRTVDHVARPELVGDCRGHTGPPKIPQGHASQGDQGDLQPLVASFFS